MDKTIVEIYRDCLRLASMVGVKTGNSKALRKHIRSQFKAHVNESDPKEIERFKTNAMRGLSNYFIFEQVKQVNPRFQEKSYEEQEQEYNARMKAKVELYKKALEQNNSAKS